MAWRQRHAGRSGRGRREPVFFALAGAALLAAAACGCGRSDRPETVPLNGKVTYNGKPLTRGTVLLTPDGSGYAATGEIQPDGTFKLTSFDKDDGAVPGKYRVAVQVFPEEGGLPGAESAGGKPPVPAKYMAPSTSGIIVEIKPGEKDLNLQLKD